MTSRPALVRSIPFWVLFVGSLVLTGLGVFLVVERLGRIESAIVNQSAEAGVEVYVGQPAVFAGAVVLGAGLFGLLLTLTVAAISTLRTAPAVEVVEAIDWTSDEQSAPESVEVAPATTATPVVADSTSASVSPSATDSPAEPISEDPDVETPSDAPAPTQR